MKKTKSINQVHSRKKECCPNVKEKRWSRNEPYSGKEKKRSDNVLESQKGITLLEYTAGAAIIIGLVWGAMSVMGANLQNVFQSIAGWAQHRADQINQGDGSPSGD